MWDMQWDNAKRHAYMMETGLLKPRENVGNSGELNVQFGGDDRIAIWAGTVADKYDYYFCNL